MTGKQSSLFFEAIRIIKEMREASDGIYPRWIVWENVPGAFSSNGGADFGQVLTEIARVAEPQAPAVRTADQAAWPGAGLLLGDGWSLAYRVLDAQWWVPQRRKRIYLVADFGSERAADILFEPKGMRRDIAPGGLPWEGAAGGAATGAGGTVSFEPGAVARLRSPHYYDNYAGTLRADMGDNQTAVVYDARGNGDGATANTITGDHGNRVTDYTALVAFSIGAYGSGGMLSSNPQAGIYEADTARTIDANGGNPACNQGGMAVVFDGAQVTSKTNRSNPQPGAPCHTLASGSAGNSLLCAYGIGNGQPNQAVTHEQAGTLTCMHDAPAVCIDCRNHRARDISGTLQAKSNGGQSLNFINPVVSNYIVRRLTPRECAKLQGFPPDWCSGLGTPEPTEEDITFWSEVFETHRGIMGSGTKPKSRKQIIKWLRDPHTDSAEYKLWGNGVALPCVVFVMQGIVGLYQETA